MKAPRLLLLVLLLLLPPTTASAEEQASRFLTVRPNGFGGPLVLYDLETLRPGLRLPNGLPSADGGSFMSARVVGARTVITRHELPSGRVAGRGSVVGQFTLAAISANGTRAVLAALRPGPGQTRLAVLGTSRWTVQRRVSLRGSYGVEALSLDGRRLFLIQYGGGGYNLRLYDLRTGRLSFTPLVEGASGFGKMVGAPWTSVTTRDGRWLLTLYIKPSGGGFVHALDLRSAIGHCVDLPSGFTDAARLRTASLALSPEERVLYVASPLAGRLLVLDLLPPRIERTVRFSVPPTSATRDIVGAATVSSSGNMLAFAVHGQVWRYRVGGGIVSGPTEAGGRVRGLGFTAGGRRIVVVHRDGRATVLDAETGRRLR